jgi:hypothetical protein
MPRDDCIKVKATIMQPAPPTPRRNLAKLTKAELITALQGEEAALEMKVGANLDLRSHQDECHRILDASTIVGGVLEERVNAAMKSLFDSEQAERRGEITIEEQLHAIEAQRERIYSLRADIRDAEAESQTWEKAFEATLNKLVGLAGVASAAMANRKGDK